MLHAGDPLPLTVSGFALYGDGHNAARGHQRRKLRFRQFGLSTTFRDLFFPDSARTDSVADRNSVEIADMKIRSQLLVKMLVWCIVFIIRAIMLTCRKVYVVPDPRLRLDHKVSPEDSERFVGVVWHDQMLIPTFASHRENRRRTSCLISQHQDGSYLAEVMRILELTPVRGSSSRGGAQALRQLKEDVQGMHVVITPDGPRGPKHFIKEGAVFVASFTNRPILACAYSCKRDWRIQGKWTHQVIPKPFTTIYLVHSQPITVPRGVSREELLEYTDRVQRELDAVNIEAERLCGRVYVPPQRDVALSAAA